MFCSEAVLWGVYEVDISNLMLKSRGFKALE